MCSSVVCELLDILKVRGYIVLSMVPNKVKYPSVIFKNYPEPPPISGAKYIQLGHEKFTIVDEEDYEVINSYNWSLRKPTKTNNNYYAKGGIGQGRLVYLHQFIMNFPTLLIDHINHNGLDNRKSNLRLCVQSQNNQNNLKRALKTSQYKGVSWGNKKWRVHIMCNGKLIYLGSFLSEEEAALVYNEKALELFGEFACLNIINKHDEYFARSG